ncbi:MAG TPA: sigma 54-interacting transcriptional regulator [Polyangiaceae bacterium]|nr:sigma 54-interacting transcriptional regulator [Polyangiaceae bacterium]
MKSGESRTRTIARSPALAAPLPVRVRVVGASTAPLRIEEGAATLGASSTCDLVVDDLAVSRRHVELELAPEGVLVRDLGSRNGTFYLGQRVERIVLTPGSMFRIGAQTIAIELAPDAVGPGEPLKVAGFRGLVGASEVMQRLFGMLARLDGSMVPVLVQGETGAGKELVARALHEGSRVAEGPFVPVNCGAISQNLVASTLFGHKKGAFTGATDTRLGAFAAAAGGTLMLDEIGELPLEVQPALLRALERGEVSAVGEDVPRRVDVRVIAATNRDLTAEIAAGRFREDLYYRLAVVRLRVPPLRERPSDIAPLAELFAREEGAPGLPTELLEELGRRPFPGNVRELRNTVRAFVALGDLDDSAPAPAPAGVDAALAASVRLDAPFLEQREAIAARFTELYVERVLAETGGNQTLAAKLAGLDRTYFGRLLAKLGRR